ncbi:NnrS family protein [Polaromonas sp. A23]|uniref:NnrS family protein n=1 Tax=Polaromonas sp. A23 TaxID=1944133 RepID=UPI0009862D15|nr:NnrS family protein [Polaromonas sp. A23]OOG46509.1 short-chain dehydrogenase [Polaromonas sp. A23]
MSERPAIALRVSPGKPSASERARVDRRWRASHLLLAPHRLGFFLAMVVLVGAGAWWALVQLDRASPALSLPYALSPSLVHGTVMTFGFLPLFFSGFLFTAGPKWLGVPPLAPRQLRVPLLLQVAGWLLWLAGAHLHGLTALVGLAMAAAGLGWMTALFWGLLRRSPVEDQVHARTIGVACVVGCLALAGLALSLLLGAPVVARACMLTGLWGFVVVVYVSVAHRMIPFFTSSALPFIDVWRPFWVLRLMLAVAAVEVAAVWMEFDGQSQGAGGTAWTAVRGVFELAAGGVFLWLAVVWGLMQSLKNRLLAMLHIGFLWFGLALVLGGVAQLLGLVEDAPVLPLGALHALTMGCLASLMLAMVTRVSCGHSGRALVADRLVWTLFWLLQAATLLRIGAAAQSAFAAWLLLAAVLLWAGVMGVWGVRLGNWYGRLRADGRPG